MKPSLIFLSLLVLPFVTPAQTGSISNAQYKEDFNFFCTSVENEYCYFAKKQINWQEVKNIYAPLIDKVTNRNQFVTIVEKALNEIYDHHAILNTNTDSSRRLVPSGTDTWAEYVKGKPVITETRKGFGTAKCGILPGMEVVAVNDIAVQNAIVPFLPKALKTVNDEAKSFALRLLLAGNHLQPRKFTLKYNGATKDYFPDKDGMQLEHIAYAAKLESKRMGTTGYIKINDCLYDNGLIPAFDSVMESMVATTSLVIDLRETPSGGSTTVARAILSWFITKEQFYQKHEYYAEEKEMGIKRSWEEIVSPRKGKYYSKPLVILCNHWTGSIAEGITIGFDALHRPNTVIIGTAMARLNGAVYTYEMPNTKIHFTFPAERLYHISGLPRELYIPSGFIDLMDNKTNTDEDIFISRALQFFKAHQ